MAEHPTNTPTTAPDRATAAMPAQPVIWVLIPCAGVGTRAGTRQPKQYQPVAGQAMVSHTLAAFAAVGRVRQILVLLAPDDTDFANLPVRDAGDAVAAVPCGGTTRAATVTNGLAALAARGAQDDDWVLVHDAARCLITPALIERLIDACLDDAVGGLLALPVPDTIKMAHGERVAMTVDRSQYWLAQTPQMFHVGGLRRALEQAGDTVTDEASAIESLGLAPRLVTGDPTNFKVTVAQDFSLAESVLLARAGMDHEQGKTQ